MRHVDVFTFTQYRVRAPGRYTAVRCLATRSEWRAGRFPRDKAYALNMAFARRAWIVLLFVGAAPMMLVPWALWATDGALQGAVIGAAVISGPWLALLTVVSFSGAGSMTVAAAAEEWTVAALQRSKGWRLVNDVQLDQQIDHVAVGPKGVLVVETKWSAEAWSPDVQFMADWLERSQWQAAEARRKIELWLRPRLQGAPVYGALVLWSPQGAPGIQAEPPAPGQLSTIPAAEFARWLKDVPASDDALAAVPAIWSALRDQVRRVEDARTEKDGPPRKQLLSRVIRMFVWPVIAAACALYLVTFTSGAPWPVAPVGLLLAIGLGVFFRRDARVRPAAHAWIATNFGLLVLWIVLVIINTAR